MIAGRRGTLWLATFVGLWAVVEALAIGVLGRYSPYQVVFTRYVVHLALMGLVWGVRAPTSLVRTRRPVYQLVRSLMMLAMPASYVLSHQYGVNGNTVMTLFWISPLLILALARLSLREQVPRLVWAAAIVGCAGAALAYGHRGLRPRLPLLFPLTMAISFSVYVVMTRSLRDEPTRANLFYSALGVAASLLPTIPGLWVTPTLRDLALMIGIGVVGFGALFALDRATAAAPLADTMPVAYLQLVFTFIIDRVLRREAVDRTTSAGLLLITAAALVTWLRVPRMSTGGTT